MADPGGYESGRQASLLGLPYLPGRPIWRSGGELCPTILQRTEADGGVPSHPVLVVCCCLHPTAIPPSALIAEGALLLPPPPLQLGLSSSLHTGQSVELMAGKRGSPSPPLPSKRRSFCFLFVLFRRWLPSQWYSKTQKIVSFFSWSQ